MKIVKHLAAEYHRIEREAEQLAGGLNDLAQRAAVYHHLYEHSAGNHVFPLIAAHGALWAQGYFRFGMKIGRLLSWQFAVNTSTRRLKLELLADFADAFRNVNRLVCIETYTKYHFAHSFGTDPQASQFIEPQLLAQLNIVHHAVRTRQQLSTAEQRAVFEAFFLHEQEQVVGPKIQEAVERFDWRVMRSLALMPHVRFAYMPRMGLQFFNFSHKQERITNGLRAFDIAAAVGFKKVASLLGDYNIMPASFFANSREHFSGLRDAVALAS